MMIMSVLGDGFGKWLSVMLRTKKHLEKTTVTVSQITLDYK